MKKMMVLAAMLACFSAHADQSYGVDYLTCEAGDEACLRAGQTRAEAQCWHAAVYTCGSYTRPLYPRAYSVSWSQCQEHDNGYTNTYCQAFCSYTCR
jgi:hypothetical protein